MAGFKYEAMNKTGALMTGVLNADTARQARLRLREQDLTPLKVIELRSDTMGGFKRALFGRRVSTATLNITTRQFASLLSAGVTVERALTAIIKQTDSKAMQQALAGVRGKVIEGSSLADAMRGFPSVFSELYQTMVAVGEKSGELDKVLTSLADYIEQNHRLKRKVGIAFIYPAILTIVAAAVVTGLLAYVVPKVVAVFLRTNQELPFLTKILIAVSDHLRVAGVWWALAIVGGVVIVKMLLKDENRRMWLHMRLLRLPMLGKFIKSINSVRLSNTLAILVGSGVPLASAIEAGVGVLKSLPMRKALKKVLDDILKGTSFSQAMEGSGLFPPLMIHFIASGEESDRLGEMLRKASSQGMEELESRIAVFISLVEPALILIMGIMVLLIVLAILMPVFEMNQIVR